MLIHRFQKGFVFFLCLICVLTTMTWAQNLKRKAGFDLNWKFYKGTPAGTPSAASFTDASWENVNVPHSPSYDSAAWSAEQKHYAGDCWYRKTFTIPQEAKKVFIEFEGAMSVATLWVNGTQVGIHDNSGYTPFCYDISSNITKGNSNVIALKLNNQNNANIPPGQTIDFNLFGGLYRHVWLRFKEDVYVPINTQQIITENVSATSAIIHAVTAVKNDASTAQTCQVLVSLFDAANVKVATKTSEMSIAAKTLDTFDMKTDAIPTPHLWSPTSPYLYKVQTLVSVAGKVVDSVEESCGIRWLTWNPSQGFYLNGSRLEIRGMCVHQTEGWIGDAVPESRHFQEVKMLKNMGCNSLRCSHYPRDQAFYDICDKMGMLLYVEIPTWGYGQTPNAARWTRSDSCVKEMILSGRNHPCIYIWGLYNEPLTSGDFTSQITPMNTTAHRLDTTRFTAMANIPSFNAAISVPDVEGLNYTLKGNAGRRWLNTESRHNFTVASFRGSSIDLDTTPDNTTTGTAADEWGEMAFTLNTSGQLAGGHFWCFKDYNSGANLTGYEGVVDRLTIPKTSFYMFRKNWTGEATDYPKSGTPTKIEFTADTTSLNATGSEVFLLTATMRDANNRQIVSAKSNATFTISPISAATLFGGNSQPVIAGRIGVLLRTSTTATTFTVTVSYPGLPAATLTLKTLPIEESYYDGPVSVQTPKSSVTKNQVPTFAVSQMQNNLVFSCPGAGRISIINSLGKTVFTREVIIGNRLIVDKKAICAGVYYSLWEKGNLKLYSKVLSVNK